MYRRTCKKACLSPKNRFSDENSKIYKQTNQENQENFPRDNWNWEWEVKNLKNQLSKLKNMFFKCKQWRYDWKFFTSTHSQNLSHHHYWLTYIPLREYRYYCLFAPPSSPPSPTSPLFSLSPTPMTHSHTKKRSENETNMHEKKRRRRS